MNERMGSVTVLRCAGCEAHKQRIAELEAQVEEFKDRVLRIAAQMQNLRCRVIRAAKGEAE